MRIPFRIFFVVKCCSLGCAGPATYHPTVSFPELQQEITIQARDQYREQTESALRIQRIYDHLLHASLGMCQQLKPQMGFFYADPLRLSVDNPIKQALLLDYMGLEGETYPIVSYVRPSSPAEKAGLQMKDRIIAVGKQSAQAQYRTYTNRNMINNNSTETWHKLVGTLESILAPIPTNHAVSLQVRRSTGLGDTLFTVQIHKMPMCDYRVFLMEANQKNAYTDGSNVFVTKGMYASSSDEDLALVMAHELAHIFEDHIDKKRQNAFVGSVGGAILDGLATTLGVPTYGRYTRQARYAGAALHSQAFEKESDYIGLYIMARAGYSTANAADFWRKMAEPDPMGANRFAGSHPPTAERYILLHKTHIEIEDKIAQGQPLVPNRIITQVP